MYRSLRAALAAGGLAFGLAWAGVATAQTVCHTEMIGFPPAMQQVCTSQSSYSSSSASSSGSSESRVSFGPARERRDDSDDRDRSEGGGRPRLVQRAQIGRIREILGAARLVAGADPACAPKSVVDGLCFAGAVRDLATLGQSQALVLGIRRPAAADTVLRGRYGEDFALYVVSLDGGALSASALPRQESEVSVPRACFALPDEAVNYRLEMRGAQAVAQEVQTVVCGGGPAAPRGPYEVEIRAPASAEPALGAAPGPEPGAYPPTGAWMATGPRRSLAVPDPACDPVHLVHATFCARSGVEALKADPAQKELDLVVAKAPARPGDLLPRGEVEQWVLKRHGDGFKADKRWFAKYYLPTRAGCTAAEPGRFRVVGQDGAFFVTEVALNACGAPPAPVPADIYEVDGAQLPVAVHRDNCPQNEVLVDDLCFADAIDFMAGFGRTSTPVVLLRGEVYPSARLFAGQGLQVVTLTRHDDGGFETGDGGLPEDGFTLDRCAPLDNGDPRREGVRIEARGERPIAVAYRWMSCPIY